MDRTEEEIQALFKDPLKHQERVDVAGLFSNNVVKDLSAICKKDFNVKVKQKQREQPWQYDYLLFFGLDCLNAKKWLLEKQSDLEKLSFPDDWENPVKHFLADTNLHTYMLPNGHKTWNDIENRIGKHGKIQSIAVIQNIALWQKFQLETRQMMHRLGKQPRIELLWHGTS